MITFDLHKIPNIRVVAVILMTFSSIFPPYNFIRQLDHRILVNNDLLNLLLISFSYGFPLVIWHTALIRLSIIGKHDDISDQGLWPESAILGSILTMSFFYCPCAFAIYPNSPKWMSWPFESKISLSGITVFMIGLETIISVIYFRKFFMGIKKKQNISNNPTPPAHQTPDLPPSPAPLPTNDAAVPGQGHQQHQQKDL